MGTKEAKIDKLAKKLTKLVEIFRRGEKAKDFEWWNHNSPLSIFKPLYGYQDGQLLFKEVVEGIISLNPEMLSDHWVHRELIFEFLTYQTISVTKEQHLSNQSLVNEAKKQVNKLIDFENRQNIDGFS